MILFLNKCLLGSMVSLLVNTIFSDQLLAYSFSSSELNKLSDITLRRDLKSFQISNSYLISNSKAESYSNISQLLDVSHQDWAFTALQLIANRYKCLTGDRDLNYQGDRNLTRYEFAAAIRACSDRLTQQLQITIKNKISQADLLTLQKLQTDFAIELSSLTHIVTNLEAKTTNVEAKSFSPTTKLNGVAIMSIATYASKTDFAQPATDVEQNSIISALLGLRGINV